MLTNAVPGVAVGGGEVRQAHGADIRCAARQRKADAGGAVRKGKRGCALVVAQKFPRHADVVALGIAVAALVCLHHHGGHRGLPVRIGPPCRYGDGTFSRPVVRVVAAEGGGKVVGRGGYAVCFHFAAYLDGDRSHALPVAVHRGAGAGGGCRRGIQPRGGEAAAARSRASAGNVYRVYRFISSCFYWLLCNTGRPSVPDVHW